MGRGRILGEPHTELRLDWINSPLVSPSVYDLIGKTQTTQGRYHTKLTRDTSDTAVVQSVKSSRQI